jgi:hypothetical protein
MFLYFFYSVLVICFKTFFDKFIHRTKRFLKRQHHAETTPSYVNVSMSDIWHIQVVYSSSYSNHYKMCGEKISRFCFCFSMKNILPYPMLKVYQDKVSFKLFNETGRFLSYKFLNNLKRNQWRRVQWAACEASSFFLKCFFKKLIKLGLTARPSLTYV